MKTDSAQNNVKQTVSSLNSGAVISTAGASLMTGAPDRRWSTERTHSVARGLPMPSLSLLLLLFL